jgi:hypothetical protein
MLDEIIFEPQNNNHYEVFMKKIILALIILVFMACEQSNSVLVKNETSQIITYTLKVNGNRDYGDERPYTIQPYDEKMHDLGNYHKMVNFNAKLIQSIYCESNFTQYTFKEIEPFELDIKNTLSENIKLSAKGYIVGEPLTVTGKISGQVMTKTPEFKATTLDGYPVTITSSFNGTKFLVTIH